MKKPFTLILLTGVVIAILPITGCVPRGSVLLKDKCEFPCWNEIEINMSVEEVKSRLEDMPEVDATTIRVKEKPYRDVEEAIFFSFVSQDFYDAGFYFENDQLKVIVFGNAKGRSSYLGFWVEKLGEPSSLILLGGVLTHGILTHSYYYDNLSICFEGRFYQKHVTFNITRTTLIDEVTLFDPQSET